ncbi:MAG: hypothetical protein ACO3JG_11250 [Luteolibacter sp.]
MVPSLQSPEQELRFTRSRQAVAFWIGGAVMSMAAIVIAAASFHRAENPALPHPAWALGPALAAGLLTRGAVRLTRHAYVILTPLGIEIFPFFRPAAGMRLVAWQELREMDTNASLTRLTLHFNVEKTSGIHLSLRPVRADRRRFLVEAVRRRLRRD